MGSLRFQSKTLENCGTNIKNVSIVYQGPNSIKNKTQTAVINIINFFYAFLYKLDVLYAGQHTFSKVTVTILTNLLYNSDKGSGTKIKKTILTVNL